MWRTFIQVLVLSTTLISSYFLIEGMLVLSKNDIAGLSETRWGYNLDVANNLCRQRADTLVGFLLLLLSFLLQLINILWQLRMRDFATNWKGVISAIIVSFIIFLVANSISNLFYRKSFTQVENILKKR